VVSGSVLSGRLEAFRLVELLQMMGLGPSSGALHLHKDAGEAGILYFDRGTLVSCTELDTEALTLGHVLQQLDLVTAPELDYAFRQQKADPFGKRIGERLIDLGLLTAEMLHDALRTQTMWIARELAQWNAGWYEFHPGEHLPAQAGMPRIDVQDVMMEMLRHEHAWEPLQPYLADGMRTRLALPVEPPRGHPLRFAAEDWLVIAKVNQHQTIRRIATALRVPELQVAQRAGMMVRQGVLVPLGGAGGPGLPKEAELLNMQHFDLFTLLISMEHDWHKRRSLADRLTTMAGFINQTMRALADACQESGLTLAPDTLASLLAQRGVVGVNDHRFTIENNRLDVETFGRFCKRSLEGSSRDAIGAAKQFYDQAYDALERALTAAFEVINARVASPTERGQNREAWEALFQTFREQPSAG
jgi:uncharacterized protein DUF4388